MPFQFVLPLSPRSLNLDCPHLQSIRVTQEPVTPFCRSTLSFSRCSLLHSLQIAYIIALLTRQAGELFCTTLQGFTAEMKRVFDHSTHGREPACELLQLRQGNSLVSDFAIAFQTLALSTGWDMQVQFDAFYNGLS